MIQKLIFLSILLLAAVLFFIIARENMLNGLFFRHSFSSIFGDLSVPTMMDFKSSNFNGAKDSVNKESLHFYIIDNLFQKKQESITITKNVPSILSVDSPYLKNRKGIVLDSIESTILIFIHLFLFYTCIMYLFIRWRRRIN